MDTTQKLLLKETEKWRAKLEAASLTPSQQSPEVKEQITNIQAYISDCKHFLEKKDFIRAFEAIVYAWGIYDALLSTHLLKFGTEY